MAIEIISNTPGFQTMGVGQVAQVQPVSKPEENVSTEGGNLTEAQIRPDVQTVAVDIAHQAAEDGENGQGSSPQDEAAQKKENEKIKKAVEDLNKKMDHSVAKFGIHEATNRVTIKIVDKDTDKVIKELPPEKTLDMIAKAWELAGILVDEKR